GIRDFHVTGVQTCAFRSVGADGFGYQLVDGRHVKVPQSGGVIIEEDVEIGANSCVDRGTFGPTRIGAGTKIDNLVQVGHNVRLEIGRAAGREREKRVAGS